MLYSCTHMATVGFKGLTRLSPLLQHWFVQCRRYLMIMLLVKVISYDLSVVAVSVVCSCPTVLQFLLLCCCSSLPSRFILFSLFWQWRRLQHSTSSLALGPDSRSLLSALYTALQFACFKIQLKLFSAALLIDLSSLRSYLLQQYSIAFNIMLSVLA